MLPASRHDSQRRQNMIPLSLGEHWVESSAAFSGIASAAVREGVLASQSTGRGWTLRVIDLG